MADDFALLGNRPAPTRPIRTPGESIYDIINRQDSPPGMPEPANELHSLPDESYDYRPFARPAARPLMMLHLLLAREPWHDVFAYADLRRMHRISNGNAPGELGWALFFAFNGLTEVRLFGRGRDMNLLIDYLSQGRIHWIREMPAGKDYEDEGATVIHRINVVPAEPER